VREIGEETGLCIAAEDLTHLAFTEGFGQVGPVRGPMRDDVFIASAPPSTDLSTERFEHHEREAFEGYRWWPIKTLRGTTEVVFPRELGRTLSRYVEVSNWPKPVRLPW
jgi:hypothetical protein